MAADYKSTVLLPKADVFPMKADLPKREPAVLAAWNDQKIFARIMDARERAPIFALHDGPPYANGSIHQGHILNKILKDIVVKHRTMAGFKCDYIPGWDCHGLPIEQALEKEMGPEAKAAMDKVAFRKMCREFALKWVDVQREEFKRLGIFGRWETPYMTMDRGFEAIIAREFGRFVGNGGVYRGLRPVQWCWNDQTALAEAEVEYAKKDDPSVYVKFELPAGELPDDAKKAVGSRKAFVVIWTTTPWTLPANLGIAMHPDLDYVWIEPESKPGEAWLVAKGRLEGFSSDASVGPSKTLGATDPKKLERKHALHPFMKSVDGTPRPSLLVLADYVTLEAGTGCVHTAPGHGQDDFQTGQRYELDTLVPVNDKGVLTPDAGPFAGEFIYKANPKIVDALAASGHLVKSVVVNHDYPHCWRCKKPVITRATTQWFISMTTNDLRKDALEAIEKVKWIPHYGHDRIHGMIASRPDWCISRQRTWGVPIVAFKCTGCEWVHTTEPIVERVVKNFFEKEGADAWYSHEANELIGGEACPKCGKKDWKRSEDILDVWFESGVSWAAVCETNENLGFPVDLYLEGSDQHRGWFHSTLLASVGTRGKNAYKSCLTHGWVVGGDGEKLSKSKKNYTPLDKVLEQNGADILRLWVAASDYREDVRLSDEIMDRVKESYRKIRNTAKFALTVLFDFNPEKDRVAYGEMLEIDRWLLHRASLLAETMKKAYEEYEFHVIHREAVNFCTVDLSAFYATALKDRLYCAGQSSRERRSSQTALYEALSILVRAIAPVLAFTAEEIWTALPATSSKEPSVHLAAFPAPPAEWRDEALATRWTVLLQTRDVVLKALEEQRNAKAALFKERDEIRKKKDAASAAETTRLDQLNRELVGGADEAAVTLGAPDRAFLEANRVALKEALGVSAIAFEDAPALRATVAHAKGNECPRCRFWYEQLVGEICARCASVVGTK